MFEGRKPTARRAGNSAECGAIAAGCSERDGLFCRKSGLRGAMPLAAGVCLFYNKRQGRVKRIQIYNRGKPHVFQRFIRLFGFKIFRIRMLPARAMPAPQRGVPLRSARLRNISSSPCYANAMGLPIFPLQEKAAFTSTSAAQNKTLASCRAESSNGNDRG